MQIILIINIKIMNNNFYGKIILIAKRKRRIILLFFFFLEFRAVNKLEKKIVFKSHIIMSIVKNKFPDCRYLI